MRREKLQIMMQILETATTTSSFYKIICKTEVSTQTARTAIEELINLGLFRKEIALKKYVRNSHALSDKPRKYARPSYFVTEKGRECVKAWRVLKQFLGDAKP